MKENDRTAKSEGIYLLLSDASLIGPLTLEQMEEFGLSNAKGVIALRVGHNHWHSLPGGGVEWVRRAKYLCSQVDIDQLCLPNPADRIWAEYLSGLTCGAAILTGIGYLAGFGDPRALLAAALLAIGGIWVQIRMIRKKG